MAFGSPSKYCPRCNSLLPAQATVCSNCGMQFAESQPASGYGATQYGGSGAPGSWPQSQPTYPANQPGWSPGSPSYEYPAPGQAGYPQAGYTAAPTAAASGRSNKGLLITLAVVVVLVGAGVASWFLYLAPSHCSGPLFDRHGLQNNIPLPSHCMFNTKITRDIGNSESADYWVWTVDSPNNPSTLNAFYTQQLSSNGWQQEQAQTSKGQSIFVDCQNGEALVVELTLKVQGNDTNLNINVTAPSGGSVLLIATTSGPKAVADTCKPG